MPSSSYIVFQCYGYERVFHECAYALLSLARIYKSGMPGNIQVWIYTDKPEWFQSFKDCPLPLSFRKITMDDVKQWRGKIDFVHRVKIELLKDFTHDREGNVLYLDTDVVFTDTVEDVFAHIAQGERYMHIMEGKISDAGNPIFRKLNEYLAANRLQLNGRPLNGMNMWNAGVLGFYTTDKPILDDVLAFTDREYPRFPKHVVEQFAFSVHMAQGHDIKAACPYLLHYWNLKEAGMVLASFFDYFKNRPWSELVPLSTLIQVPALMQEKINFYQGRSLMDKIRKKTWRPPEIDWNEMERQL